MLVNIIFWSLVVLSLIALIFIFISIIVILVQWRLKYIPAYNARIKYLNYELDYHTQAKNFHEENVKKLKNGYIQKQLDKGIPLERIMRKWEVESQFISKSI